MQLTIYGSFDCPYSYLASLRVDRLAGRGLAEVDWRAVVHDPDVPAGGAPVSGRLERLFDRELAEIRELVEDGERYGAVRPSLQPDTTAAVAAYAQAGDDGPRLRTALFETLWVDGLDLGDADVLAGLGAPAPAGSPVADRWRTEWLALDRHLVPMGILPGGKVSRGLGLLQRLADLAHDHPAG